MIFRSANRLLNADPNRPEDGVRQDIIRLLDDWGLESVLSYRTQSGLADIYLPNRRVFIETKTVGLADNPHAPQARQKAETPYQQVERYLKAELMDELGRLPFNEQPDLPWTGIVTDGRVWHVWRFPHTRDVRPEPVLDSFRPQSADELVQTIRPIVSAECVGKPWVPSDPVPLFVRSLDDLRAIHANIAGARVQQATDTKMQLWLDMLRGSGMAPEKESAQVRLFTAHCFLVTLARGVIHTLLKPNVPPNGLDILGHGYLAWIVDVEDGRVWACELLDRIHSYEWKRTAGDVLRPLYETFVDSDDRKDFGEVYTPDWLAEMMVHEVLDDAWCTDAVISALSELRGQGRTDGIGVLDPTCGSGTFLYHCARRILACPAAEGLQPIQKSDVVCRLVHGIDIHPVAVEFSRATLLRALPATPSTSDTALGIYQGDALMLRQNDKNTLFEPRNGEISIRSPQGREILIPRTFSEHMEFPDMLRRMVNAAAQGTVLPVDIGHAMGQDEDKLIACHKGLTEIIEAEGNSVWTWYITNVLGPDRLARRKVNRIVANPPWVKLSNIQVVERKRALERMAGKDGHVGHLNLWIGGKQAPHFDIAQLFLRHVRGAYLNQPKTDSAAWVTKASAIRAGNWKKFRSWHSEYLAQALDLSDVRVFGGGDARRSSVLFEVRPSTLSVDGDAPILKATCPGPVPAAFLPWDEAQSCLCWETLDLFPQAMSDYGPDDWRQGATIVPKVLTTAEVVSAQHSPDRRSVTTIRSDKDPWKLVQPRTGNLPTHWLVPLFTSRHLLPFGMTACTFETVIIPRNADGELLTTDVARQTPFWAELDDLYRERRGRGGNTPKTLMARIDYAGTLSRQLPLQSQSGCLVVYPTSGDIMRAAHVVAGTAVLDSKLYRRPVGSVKEARYLVAILNAPSLENAFRVSRTSGRHFHKNPWRSVPIPAWDDGNSHHQELAILAQRAEEMVAAMDLPSGQVQASRRIRERLDERGLLREIDEQVRPILPRHVTEK